MSGRGYQKLMTKNIPKLLIVNPDNEVHSKFVKFEKDFAKKKDVSSERVFSTSGIIVTLSPNKPQSRESGDADISF